MENQQKTYARTQADGLDNIAPTALQGKQAWQYAKSDNFFSPEEQAAVLRKELETQRPDIMNKLSQIGYTEDFLKKHPKVEQDLFAGKQTDPLYVNLTPEINMLGRLRIVSTEQGPELRITPAHPKPQIPDEVGGFKLSNLDKKQLLEEGAVSRPYMIPDKGTFTPTYLRIDPATNTPELYKVKPEQMPSVLLGIDLTKDQQQQLASGYPVRLAGLRDSQNEPFNATVSLSPAQKNLQFGDISRQSLAIRPDAENSRQVVQNNEGGKTDQTKGQEQRTGLPAATNNQSEAVRQLLGTKNEAEVSPAGAKLRVS